MKTAKKIVKKTVKVPKPQVGSPLGKTEATFVPGIVPVPEKDLKRNLEKYRKLALELGAIESEIIAARDIPQDIRSYYALCVFPRCRWMNASTNCPTLRAQTDIDEAKETLLSYRYAVAYKILPPDPKIVKEAAETVGKINLDLYWTMGRGKAPDPAALLSDIVRLRLVSEIIRKVEQAAYYDGYSYAASPGIGPCLVTWCSSDRTCRGLEKAGFCPISNSRPPGNYSFYIDFYTLGKKLGWGNMQNRANCALLSEGARPEGFYNIGLTLVD